LKTGKTELKNERKEKKITMKQLSYVKKIVYTAVCMALCVVLPMAFHFIPNAGSILCPMHIPVLLCGLICGAFYGVLCGLAGPLLSMLITGMPGAAYLLPMMLELAVYGLVTGLGMRWIRTNKTYADLEISLVAAMLIGRVVAGAARALIFAPGSYSMAIWISSYFVTSLPGILVQLVLIPPIVLALMKARLVPTRYDRHRAAI
jgi:thiamine transporter ThiT